MIRVSLSGRQDWVLTLLDLRADDCTQIGIPTGVVRVMSHAVGRALGKATHAEHPRLPTGQSGATHDRSCTVETGSGASGHWNVARCAV